MSAVAELDRQERDASNEASPSDPLPSEEQMLDVLYEVLATGPAPKSKVTREQVERFLHEHARSAKPIRDMVAFFREHDLPLGMAEEYGTDAELRELASGLQRERSSLVPGMMLAEPEEPPALPPATVEALRREAQPAHAHEAQPVFAHEAQPVLAAEDVVSTGRHAAVVVAVPAKSPLHPGVWAAAAAVLLALGGGLTFSYLHASQLETRLEQARMEQQSTDAALTKLEERAESLRGELAQSEADRHAQQARFEDALAAQAKQRATESLAVEKVLGARYTKLRQKLASEAEPAQ